MPPRGRSVPIVGATPCFPPKTSDVNFRHITTGSSTYPSTPCWGASSSLAPSSWAGPTIAGTGHAHLQSGTTEPRSAAIRAFAERVLPRAADLWVQASLEQRQRFQQLFFPDGIAFDGNGVVRTAAYGHRPSSVLAGNSRPEMQVFGGPDLPETATH